MDKAGLRLGRIWISSWKGEHLEFRKTTALRRRIYLKPKVHGGEFKKKLLGPISPSEACSLLSFSFLNKKEDRLKLLILFPIFTSGQVLP